MKRNSIIAAAICLLFSSCSLNSKTLNSKNEKLSFDINQNYLLIPVQESARDYPVIIHYPNNESKEFNIRLAKDSIDHWMKLNVKDFKNEKINLEINGEDIPSLALKSFKQSDTFQFDYHEKYRSRFHFTPEYGWMNDPNGMVYLDGEYHLFYQYNPYGTKWGNMHWGHAVSNDLLSWSYLNPALSPDSLGAIFSGSAVVDVNNTAGFGKNAMVAIYTSAGKVQAQSIAYSTDKGRTFKVYDKNPVIANPGIPDFRDPKVFWHNESNQWVMSLATKQTITFYASANLKDWNVLSEFGDGIGSHAGVWECPDLFPLDLNGVKKWVLIVSINPGGPNGGSATQYFIGDFNGKEFKADPLPYPLWIDHGRDNYAGVTWSNIPDADGRRLFMGWMSNWDYANEVPTKMFRSSMTLPRELKLIDGDKHPILTSYPVEQLNKISAKEYSLPELTTDNQSIIKDFIKENNGTYSIEMTIFPNNAQQFGFELLNSANEAVKFQFDLFSNYFSVNRKGSGLTQFNDKFSLGSGTGIQKQSQYRVFLVVDKASSELFIDNGKVTMTNIFFSTKTLDQLKFYTKDNQIQIKDIIINKIN